MNNDKKPENELIKPIIYLIAIIGSMWFLSLVINWYNLLEKLFSKY